MGGGGQEGPGEAPGIEPGGPGSRPCALCSRCRCLPWERGAAGDGLVPLRFQVHWWKPKPPAASPPSGASQWRRVGGTPPRTLLSRRVREGGREGWQKWSLAAPPPSRCVLHALLRLEELGPGHSSPRVRPALTALTAVSLASSPAPLGPWGRNDAPPVRQSRVTCGRSRGRRNEQARGGGQKAARAEDEASAPGHAPAIGTHPAQGPPATRDGGRARPPPAGPCRLLRRLLAEPGVPRGGLSLKTVEAWHPESGCLGLTSVRTDLGGGLTGLRPTPGGLLLLRSLRDPHASRPLFAHFLAHLLPSAPRGAWPGGA